MSAFMIRNANRNDISKIVDFVHQYWKADHIFVSNPELLDWQHSNFLGAAKSSSKARDLSFLIAEDDSKNVIALLGYIFIGDVVALALWKSIGDVGSGFALLRTVEQTFNPNSIIVVGINDNVAQVYKLAGYKVDHMRQFALVPAKNRNVPSLAVDLPDSAYSANSSEASPLSAHNARDCMSNEFWSTIDRLGKSQVPQKGRDYLEMRFSKHPWYNYIYLVCGPSEDPHCVLIIRVIKFDGFRVARVVDLIGHLPGPNQVVALRKFLVVNAFDHLDLMFWVPNIDTAGAELVKAGFTEVTGGKDGSIPNYYEPFSPHPVVLGLAIKSISSPFISPSFRIMRADGDQDRPNRLVDLL